MPWRDLGTNSLATRHPRLWLWVSLLVIGASIVAAKATDGVFPGGTVVLAELIAAAMLAPRDTLVVACLATPAGVYLAHDLGGYSGWSLVYRSLFFVAAGALAFVLTGIRVSRESRISEHEQLAALHTFTSSLFAQPDVDSIVRVAVDHGQELLQAHLIRVMIVESDRLVLAPGLEQPAGATERVVLLTESSAVSLAVRDNRPVAFTSRAEYVSRYPQWAGTAAAIGGDAMIALPVAGAHEPIGVLAVFFAEPHDFGPEEMLRLQHIAHELGVALERALLREREQIAATKLQESLLGPAIMVPNIGHEVRYLPAEAALHVGGDWYTAQPLSDGRVAIAVGDVVGRGLEAAGVMGQLRAALGAYADRSSSAAETVSLLDRYARTLPGAMSTSVAVARVDVTAATVEYSLAGHPPPVLVSPTGEVRLLEQATGWPLAILDRPQVNRPTATEPFPPGSLIVLYSDGLVERRGEALDDGLARLCDVVHRYWNRPLPLLCDSILREMVAVRRREDDIALLALRSPASTEQLFLAKQQATPAELTKLRAALRRWLDQFGIPVEDTMSILVSVGEATTNAVEHAYPDRKGLVRVEAAVTDDELVCCISDTGRWHDNSQRRARGNGLPIMQELMHDVSIERRRTGTTVTLRYKHEALAGRALAV